MRHCLHLVGVCIYKEPLDLIQVTLDSLRRQKSARKNLFVFVGMEQRTPDAQKKKETLETIYKDAFARFLVTVHPYKVPGRKN